MVLKVQNKPRYNVVRATNIRIKTRDGIHLATDLYRPNLKGRYPAILIWSAYNRKTPAYTWCARTLASQGYVVIVQDVRGRYESEGHFYPFRYDYADGYDTLQWLVTQPWFNGEVGFLGISLSSYTGLALLAGNIPEGVSIRRMVSIAGITDAYNMVYDQGVLKLHWALPWFKLVDKTKAQNNLIEYDWNSLFMTLPLSSALKAVRGSNRMNQLWRTILKHPTPDAFWNPMRINWSRIQVPILHIGGWYDYTLKMTLDAYVSLVKQARDQALIIGPWDHSTIFSLMLRDPFRMLKKRLTSVETPVDLGPDHVINLLDIVVAWFNQGFRCEERQPLNWPSIQIFTSGINRWQDSDKWPPENKEVHFYLRSNGHANSAEGDGQLSPEPPGDEPPDHYDYDPEKPVPTLGGSIWPFGRLLTPGPCDQRPIENRRDVLVYTSAPLTRDLAVTGPIEVILYAASSAPDTDFTAKLVDVHPNGYAQILQDGIIRARYRESLYAPRPIEPGRIYRYRITCGAISHVFKKGHRIRLEISSSNFPKYDRNLNTWEPFGKGTRTQVAHQSIYHSSKYPSCLILPVQQ